MRCQPTRQRQRPSHRLLAVVLAYGLLLQGLLGAFAHGALAATAAEPGLAICSGAADGPGDQPLRDLADACCATACQSTCGTALPPGGASAPAMATAPADGVAAVDGPPWHPASLGLRRDARAPPALAI